MSVRHADGSHEVLVDGIVMVHVVLHHRDDMTELGDKAAEHAAVVHPPQGIGRIDLAGQQFKEDTVRFGIIAELLVDLP